MEEAGLDLHNLTRQCIYCAFGAVSQNLEDEELKRAVYSEVVQPLEKLLLMTVASCIRVHISKVRRRSYFMIASGVC